jgi:thiamine biosynthesis lipoprotein
MAKSLDISRLSGSAFDPTVAPLVDLWGFGPKVSTVPSPGDKRIGAALGATGHAHLMVKETRTAVRKSRAGLAVDLSGIAKGFAVDRVTEFLARAGVEHFLVDIGGDMRARRASPAQATWRIGIERPAAGLRTAHRVIDIGDGAVATSGDYRNFFEADGLRYSHIIDPRTGAPVNHGLASVTVIAASTEEADAWSTALMVLGPEAGAALAERRGLPAYFISRTERGLIDRPTREFKRFLAA